jgi:hypothetical protein
MRAISFIAEWVGSATTAGPPPPGPIGKSKSSNSPLRSVVRGLLALVSRPGPLCPRPASLGGLGRRSTGRGAFPSATAGSGPWPDVACGHG